MLEARHKKEKRAGRQRQIMDKPLYEKINAETMAARKHARKRGKLTVRPGAMDYLPGSSMSGGVATGTLGSPGMPAGSPLPRLGGGVGPEGADGAAGGFGKSSSLKKALDQGYAASETGGPVLHGDHLVVASAEGILSSGPEEPRRDLDAEKLRKCHGEVRELRVSHDALKAALDGKLAELKAVQDEYVQAQKEDDIIQVRMAGDKVIIKKKEELEELSRKVVETTYYRSTLKFMLQRLQMEQRTFNSTIEAYDDAVKVRKVELKELEHHVEEIREAKAADELAVKQLQEHAAAERQDMEIKVEERRKVAEQYEEMRRWYEEAEQKEEDVRAELEGDLSAEMEKRFMDKNRRANAKMAAIEAKTDNMSDMCAEYEEAFRKLKLAVGATEDVDADYVIDKFHSREAEMDQIDGQISALHRRIAELRSQQTDLQNDLARVAQGESSKSEYDALELNRESLDKVMAAGESAKRRLATSKDVFERVRTVLLQLGQSVDALGAKLAHVQLPSAVRQKIRVPSDKKGDSTAVFVWKVQTISMKLRQLLESSDPAGAEEADEMQRRGSHPSITVSGVDDADVAQSGSPSGAASVGGGGGDATARSALSRGSRASHRDGSSPDGARSPPLGGQRSRRSTTVSDSGGRSRRQSAGGGGSGARAGAGGLDDLDLTSDDALMEMMEGIINANENNIRVRPGSGGLFRNAATMELQSVNPRVGEPGSTGYGMLAATGMASTAGAGGIAMDAKHGHGHAHGHKRKKGHGKAKGKHSKGHGSADADDDGADVPAGFDVAPPPLPLPSASYAPAEASTSRSAERRRSSRANLAEMQLAALEGVETDAPGSDVALDIAKKRAAARAVQFGVDVLARGDEDAYAVLNTAAMSHNRRREGDEDVPTREHMKHKAHQAQLRSRKGARGPGGISRGDSFRKKKGGAAGASGGAAAGAVGGASPVNAGDLSPSRKSP